MEYYNGYTVRLYPTEDQKIKIKNHIDGCRFVWNELLTVKKDTYKQTKYDMTLKDLRQHINNLRSQIDFVWLNDLSKHSLSRVAEDLLDAYKRFFNKTCKYPQYKSKHVAKKSYPVRQDGLYFTKNNEVTIEKVGRIKCKIDMFLPRGRGSIKIYNPRLFIKSNGKYMLGFTLLEKHNVPKLNKFNIGIDLGIVKLATVCSDNGLVKEYDNINKSSKVKKLISRRKALERKISKKYSTNNKLGIYDTEFTKSNNILKLEKKLKKVYRRLANIRKDYTHKVTREIVNMLPNKIFIEDLQVHNMLKNRKLSRALSEQNLGDFKIQIAYKAHRLGIPVVKVDRYYPSTKLCSKCGNKKDIDLSTRVYKCDNCGFIIGRDVNACLNLLNYK